MRKDLTARGSRIMAEPGVRADGDSDDRAWGSGRAPRFSALPMRCCCGPFLIRIRSGWCCHGWRCGRGICSTGRSRRTECSICERPLLCSRRSRRCPLFGIRFRRRMGLRSRRASTSLRRIFFRTMGAHLKLGRDFEEGDGLPQPRAEAQQPAPVRFPAISILRLRVLAKEVWKRSSCGRVGQINGSLIVGVLEPDFELLFPAQRQCRDEAGNLDGSAASIRPEPAA